MLRQVLAPIHPDGWKFVAIGAAVTVVLFLLWHPAGWLTLILTLWIAYFFRDPWRVTPTRAGLVVSPADGIVVTLGEAVPPVELAMGAAPATRIGIFLNLFDVHVARAPLAARVVGCVLIAGLVARRIVCSLGEGQLVAAGERIGIIRFGSRVDLYLPPEYVPLVALGQRMIGGETVLADRDAKEPPRQGFSH
jgi:phosphatidylserine decarboxylase